MSYQNGYANIFQKSTTFRWKHPRYYQLPGLEFVSKIIARHRDSMQRVWTGTEDDRYLSPYDGHVAKLVVQATQEIYEGTQNSTWRRTFIRNVSPVYLQLANFPYTSVPTDSALWTSSDWAMVAAKWIPACAGMLCCVSSLVGDLNVDALT